MSTGPLDSSIQELIRRKATKLSRKAGFKAQDLDDLVQELAQHLIRRWPAFNSRKSDVKAFLNTLLQNRAANILRDRYVKKRDYRRTRRLPPEAELADALVGAARRDDLELRQLFLDMAAVLGKLPPELRELANVLQQTSLRQAARRLGLPTHVFKGRLWRLREVFENHDLRRYL